MLNPFTRYLGALRRSWFWSRPSVVCLLLGVMPLVFLQVTLHEGTHCLLLLAGPGSCYGIAPFPHVFGALSTGGQTLSNVESADQMALWEAPQIVAALIIILLHRLARRVRDERLAVVVRLWILGACIDLLGNTIPSAGDWGMMAQRYGLHGLTVGAMSVTMWSVALGGLEAVPKSMLRYGVANASSGSEC